MKPEVISAKDELLKSSSEESGSEDDEDAWKLTEEVEKEFYKTLSQIKSKDPKIYQKDIEFFKDIHNSVKKPAKPSNVNPLTLRDYERKIIIEKGGELSDDEPALVDGDKQQPQPTYVEEQESLKNSLKAVVNSGFEDDGDDDDDAEWGGMFKIREKTKKEKEEEEDDYKKWLKGQRASAPDEEVVKDMKPLRDYWANPNLDEGDQFLRDYIVNKKFLGYDDDNEMEVEKLLEKSEESDQGELESKYTHRFEEPDQEFIKRYPRVMEKTLRRKNDHRKQKREEIKERKLKEKEKKRAEIKQKKKLKKKEIEDKLEELKRLTGNDQLAFDNVLKDDFDLDEHDKAMQRLFSEEFYSQDDPNFNPSEFTNYEDSTGHEDDCKEGGVFEDSEVFEDTELNCEDPNFNMDCDYDPAYDKPKEKSSRSRRRKDKHRRTTLSEAVKREKPTFDPTTHKSFQEYIEQYYAIDCEDFIGDLACRFKYRRTVPNSFGLTVEEILNADVKELESWCPIKRIHQLRPEFKEKGDVKVYSKKAADLNLKRKVLPSLFKPVEEQQTLKQENTKAFETENNEKISQGDKFLNHQTSSSSSKIENTKESTSDTKLSKSSEQKEVLVNSFKRKFEGKEAMKSKKKRKFEKQRKESKNQTTKGNKTSKMNKLIAGKKQSHESSLTEMSDARLLAYGIKPKKFRNKLKYCKNS